MSIEQLWLDVQGRIARRIGPQNHEIWVKPMRVISVAGGSVSLEVPNRYYSDWVRDNYRQVFLEEWGAALGRPVEVDFSIQDEDPAPELAPTKTRPPAAPAPPRPTVRTKLPRDKTFDGYVVGACNKFAHAAALAVADFPGSNYNPLFVFGGTGLGKTHLVHAIGNRILERDSDAGVIYTTAEDFVNDMIRALRFKRMDEFRDRYRAHADALIIDDIQFLSGKDRSQEEFFHTFEALKNAGKQVVLTSDVLPREIDKLEPRLRTRFEGGLLADIQPPDLETLLAILHSKAELLQLQMPEDTAMWIASRVKGNVRELEGALNRLAALNRFYNEPLTVDFTRRHLGKLMAEATQAITPEQIIQVTSRYFNIKVSDLKGRRKLKGIVRPRQIAMYLARSHTSLSFPDLGRAFGGRDHSTVQHAVKKITKELALDVDLKNHVQTLERSLGL